MIHFEGETRFNGKAVRVAYNQGWDTPGEWGVQFDDGRYIFIDDAYALKPKNQLDFLRHVLSGEAEPSFVSGYLQELFAGDWVAAGSSEDVVRMSLQHVNYDSCNAAADAETVQKVQAQSSVEFTELGSFFEDRDAYSEVKANLFVTQLAAFKKSVEEAMVEAAVAQARLDVFAKMQAGEPMGVGWTNETFWTNFGDTAGGKQVAGILSANS